MDMIPSDSTSLRRLLMDGVDVATLDGYDHLVELLAELPTMTDDRLQHRRDVTWAIVSGKDDGNPHIRKPGEDFGWASADEFLNCCRYEYELLTSSATRAMFEVRMSDDQREVLRRKLVERGTPQFSICIDRGENDGCTRCHEALSPDEWYLTVWNSDEDDPCGGWIICMNCAAKALPAGMPLLDVAS